MGAEVVETVVMDGDGFDDRWQWCLVADLEDSYGGEGLRWWWFVVVTVAMD